MFSLGCPDGCTECDDDENGNEVCSTCAAGYYLDVTNNLCQGEFKLKLALRTW